MLELRQQERLLRVYCGAEARTGEDQKSHVRKTNHLCMFYYV